MAPLTKTAASPNIAAADYAVIQTPDLEVTLRNEKRFAPKDWTLKYPYLARVAQALIVFGIGLYMFGMLSVFAPIYTHHLQGTIGNWYGGKTTIKGGKSSTKGGHSELVKPTFYILFCVLPVLATSLLVEFLRNFHVRQATSQLVLKFARIMRRKPSISGRVSFFSFGELLFLFFVLGGNVITFCYFAFVRLNAKRADGHVPTNQYFKTCGNAIGFASIFNFALLFIPATRNSAWMEFLNVSYANAVRYHRWVGVACVVTAFVHGAAYYVVWIREKTWREEALPCFNCNLGDKKGEDVWVNVFGELAVICMVAMGLTSIPWVRRKMYNLFYYVHQLLFLTIIFVVMHYGAAIWWLLPTAVLYIMSRVISHTNSFAPVEIKELTCLDHDIVKVVISRSVEDDSDFKIGQFVYLKVPSISKLQWHAFTISSSPRTSSTTLTIMLKSLGDWTQDLVKYADDCKKNNEQPVVYMDGYYGTSLEMYDEYSTVFLIGGGIGVTPMFAILEDIVSKLSHSEPLKQRVVFLFSFRELSLLEEIHPVLAKLKELDPTGQYFRMEFYLTRVPSDEFLVRPLDRSRLHGRNNLQPTHFTSVSTPSHAKKASACPFAEPLRFKFSKSVAYTAILVLASFLVVMMEYGDGKIEKHSDALWPLQQFVEAVLMMLSGLIVYVVIFAEHYFKKQAAKSEDKKMESYTPQTESTMAPSISTDVVTYHDLLEHYNVTMGHRPDMKASMAQVFEEHTAFRSSHANPNSNPSVGVFVSGPEAMKWSMVHAIADVGAEHFDIHEEEFEL